MRKVFYWPVIFLIILFGLCLRMRLAFLSDMWLDEVFDFFTSQSSLRQIFFGEHWDKAHPQLYFLFLHFWQKIDTTPLILRLPSLVTFIPSAWLVFLIGKKGHSLTSGLLAAILFSFNPFLAQYTWQARPYGFEILFGLLFIYASLQAVTLKDKIWLWLGIISAVLAFYTDYSFIWLFLSFLMSLTILLVRRGKKFLVEYKELLLIMMICSLIFLFQLPIFIRDLPTALKMESARPVPNMGTLNSVLGQLSGLYGFLLVNWKLGLKFIYLFIALSLAGTYFLKSKSKIKKSLFSQRARGFFGILLVISFFFPPLFSYLFSQFSFILIERNIIFSSFLLIFGLPFLVGFLMKKFKDGFLGFLTFVMIFVILGFTLSSFALGIKQLNRYDYKEQIPWSFFREEYLGGAGRKLIVWVGKEGYEIKPLVDYYLLGYDYGKNKKINYFEEKSIAVEYVYNYESLNKVIVQEYSRILIFSKLKHQKENSRMIEAVRKLACRNKECHEILILK